MLKLLHFAVQIHRHSKKNNMTAHAAQLTLYILISIFPFFIFIFTLLKYINIDLTTIEGLSRLLPEEIIEFVYLILRDLKQSDTTRTVLPLSILATVWAASRGFFSIIRSLNSAYSEDETRSYLRLRVLSLLYTLGFALILITTLTLLVFGRKILDYLLANLPLIRQWDDLLVWSRYLLSAALLFAFFMLLYLVVPNKRLKVRDALPGALFATTGWIIISLGFGIYVNFSHNYSYMYGSLTGIVLMMLWLYITSNLIMLGGEINALLSASKKQHE